MVQTQLIFMKCEDCTTEYEIHNYIMQDSSSCLLLVWTLHWCKLGNTVRRPPLRHFSRFRSWLRYWFDGKESSGFQSEDKKSNLPEEGDKELHQIHDSVVL